MQKDIVAQWDRNKGHLETYFRTTTQSEYADSYLSILKRLVGLVLTDKQYKLSRITVVDDGDWQGTQLFLIPEDVYQPSPGQYLLTHTYYGSCSGCDTLKKINQYEQGLPSEEQIAAYMTLSLHLIQKMVRLTTPENRLMDDLATMGDWLN